jgi:2-methylcitrate dehydratase PrpD
MAINRTQDDSVPNYAYGKSATPPKADEVIGLVQHQGTRGTSTRTSSVKGLDAGSAGAAAVLGRSRAASDMTGPEPVDHEVALGQRTVQSTDYRIHTHGGQQS